MWVLNRHGLKKYKTRKSQFLFLSSIEGKVQLPSAGPISLKMCELFFRIFHAVFIKYRVGAFCFQYFPFVTV